MGGEVFGAVISIHDNVSAVLKQSRASAKGFRGEVAKAKKDLAAYDKQKVKEKELRVKNTQAYKAIDSVKQRLQPLAKKVVNVVAKTEHAMEPIKRVRSELDKIKDSKTVKLAVKGAKGAAKAIGKAALGGAAAAFVAVSVAAGAAVTSAASFEAGMANVGTLLDGDVNAKLATMGTALKQVSIDTGTSTADLTDGLYQVVSAFGESTESVKQLEIASKAAKAGNATTTDAVNLLSAVTKGYGDTSAGAMQKVSDLAFLTAKLGQTTFPEMAASMGGAVAMASQLSVSQEELFGSMATLTGVTGNTAEVSTQLEGVLASFMTPSDKMAKALHQLGYESGAAALEQEGLQGIIAKLSDSVGGNTIDLANMFGEKSAKQAVLALSGELADTWQQKTAAMADASGATATAFDRQTSSVSAMAGKVKNAGAVMMTSLGQQALPYISSALSGVIDKLPAVQEVFGRVIDKVGPAIGGLVGKLGGLWESWQPVLSEIVTQFSGAFSAIQPGIQAMLDAFGGIMPYVQPVISTLTGVVAAALPVLTPIFQGISSVVSTVFPVVSQIIQEAGAKIKSVFSRITSHTSGLQKIFEVAGPAISKVLETAWSIISPIADVAIEIVGAVADAVEWAFPYIQGIIEGVWSFLEPIFDGISKGIGWVADGIKKIRGIDNEEIATDTGKGTSGSSGLSGGTSPNATVGTNATGTGYWRGGWTMVGEHGPELLNLPAGSKVEPNSTVQQLQQSGGSPITIHIDKMEVRSEQDIDAVATALAKKIKEAGDNM